MRRARAKRSALEASAAATCEAAVVEAVAADDDTAAVAPRRPATAKRKTRTIDKLARTLRNATRRQAARREGRHASPFALKAPSDDDDDDEVNNVVQRSPRSQSSRRGRKVISSSSSEDDDSLTSSEEEETSSSDDGFDCPPMNVDAVQEAIRQTRVRSRTRGGRSVGKLRKRSASAVRRKGAMGAPSPVIRPQRGESIPGHFLLPIQAGVEDATELLLLSFSLCGGR